MAKTLFKVSIKDSEAVSLSLMRTLNTFCLIHSSDDILLRWYCYVLPLIIISFILEVFFNVDLLCCWVICIFFCNFIIHLQSFWKEEKYLYYIIYIYIYIYFTQLTSEHCFVILIPLYCKLTVISWLNDCEEMKLLVPTHVVLFH